MSAFLVAAFALFLAANPPGETITLDRAGAQGVVLFNHAEHINVPPDPGSAHPAQAKSNCGGCHHTHDDRGIIQLTKCEACHGPEGDPRNPQGASLNEENHKTAFHELCIGCHANLAKATPAARSGPVDCADCHTSTPRGRG